MSIKVTSRAWDHSSQSGSNLLVLLALADHADDDGVCWPGHDRVAHKARIGIRQVQRVIKNLEVGGELYVELQHGQSGGRGYTNRYLVTVGLSEKEIEGILIRRFEKTPLEARVEANAVVEAQKQKKGDIQDQKGDIDDTLNDKKRVTSETEKGDIQDQKGDIQDQKGDIAMSPEPSWNRHRTIMNHQEESEPISEKENSPLFIALANACRYDLELINDRCRDQLAKAEEVFNKAGRTPAEIEAFELWWYENDWRGKKGEPPTLSQIGQIWGRFKSGGKGNGSLARHNGAVSAKNGTGPGRRGSNDPGPITADQWQSFRNT